jgi:hypothetical protein
MIYQQAQARLRVALGKVAVGGIEQVFTAKNGESGRTAWHPRQHGSPAQSPLSHQEAAI